MITAVFTSEFDHADVSGLWQYDYGQKLRIQGLNLPTAVEIHFSLSKSGGDSESRVGVTRDGVTEVPIPDSMLENGGTVQNYYIYAFIYLTDKDSGKTVKWIQLHVNSRPKPEAFDSPEEKELFKETIASVNESADRAETAEKSSEAWAHGHKDYPERDEDNAKYYADKAGEKAEETASNLQEVNNLANRVKENAETVANDKNAVEEFKNKAGESAKNAAVSESNAALHENNANEAQTKAETAQRAVEEAKEQVAKDKEEVLLAKNAVKESEKNVTENKEYVRRTVENFTSLAENAVDNVNIAGQNQVNNIEKAGQAALDNISTGVDETLTQSGKAADAKKTGERIDELKSDLDNYINVPHIVDFGIEKETGKAYNTTNGTYVENLSGFECASIPVNPNDTLIISGWGGDSNSYKPRFWSDTAVIETISTAEDVFTDVTVTVPSGANRLLINGRTAIQSIIVKKFSQNDVSKDFYASYGKRVGVNYSAEKTVDVFIKDYSKGKDLVVRMWGKASNNLPDFGHIGTVENDGIYVLDSIGDKTIASITRGTTDFLSPSVVYAVNNADGDYLGNTDDKLTGGWHGFNNDTSGATATARNTKFIVSCDGNPLNIGEKARGNEVTIEITNRLQGSNTEKQDGSGREIVEQYFRITIGDGFKIKVDGEIRALEDIAYQTYYGLSLYHTMPNDVYFVGCRADRGAKSVTSVNRCGDTNCLGIRQVGEENTLEMLFDSSYDLGKQYANSWGNSCIMASNKSYLVLIKGRSDGAERLQLNGGDRVYWRGYYNFYPTN